MLYWLKCVRVCAGQYPHECAVAIHTYCGEEFVAFVDKQFMDGQYMRVEKITDPGEDTVLIQTPVEFLEAVASGRTFSVLRKDLRIS